MKSLGSRFLALAAVIAALSPALAASPQQEEAVNASKRQVPSPPWPAGDERGMANTLGTGTWSRCAFHLAQPNAKVYEISHVRSNSMPLSPFGRPLAYEHVGKLGGQGIAAGRAVECQDRDAVGAGDGRDVAHGRSLAERPASASRNRA